MSRFQLLASLHFPRISLLSTGTSALDAVQHVQSNKYTCESRLPFTDGCVPCKTLTLLRSPPTLVLINPPTSAAQHAAMDFLERSERRSAFLAHVLCTVAMMHRARCTCPVSVHAPIHRVSLTPTSDLDTRLSSVMSAVLQRPSSS